MSYLAKNLTVLAYANGFTLWHYTTPDAATAVDDAGYFNDAADMLRAGDMIMANLETGGGTPKAGIFHVNSVAAGVVDVDDVTAIGGTDTN